jgi:predicted permease
MLLFWPIYVVGVGLLIGMIIAKATNTPKHHLSSVLAACAFGNSTGLPITLLNVIHANFPSTSDLGRVDPTLFLSVFLLLYPVLQWGLGGWLLSPEYRGTAIPTSTVISHDAAKNMTSAQLNGNERLEPIERPIISIAGRSVSYKAMNGQSSRTVSSADEGLYLSQQ